MPDRQWQTEKSEPDMPVHPRSCPSEPSAAQFFSRPQEHFKCNNCGRGDTEEQSEGCRARWPVQPPKPHRQIPRKHWHAEQHDRGEQVSDTVPGEGVCRRRARGSHEVDEVRFGVKVTGSTCLTPLSTPEPGNSSELASEGLETAYDNQIIPTGTSVNRVRAIIGIAAATIIVASVGLVAKSTFAHAGVWKRTDSLDRQSGTSVP